MKSPVHSIRRPLIPTGPHSSLNIDVWFCTGQCSWGIGGAALLPTNAKQCHRPPSTSQLVHLFNLQSLRQLCWYSCLCMCHPVGGRRKNTVEWNLQKCRGTMHKLAPLHMEYRPPCETDRNVMSANRVSPSPTNPNKTNHWRMPASSTWNTTWNTSTEYSRFTITGATHLIQFNHQHVDLMMQYATSIVHPLPVLSTPSQKELD